MADEDDDFELAGMNPEELATAFLEDAGMRVAALKSSRVCVKRRAETVTPPADDLQGTIAAGLASGSEQAAEHATALMLAHLILTDPEGVDSFVGWWVDLEEDDEDEVEEEEEAPAGDIHVVEED